MTRRSSTAYILVSVPLCSIAMSLIDGVLMPPYLVKSFLKVLLFLFVPLFCFLRNRDQLPLIRALFLPKKQDFFQALFLGLGIFSVILSGYFLLREIVDFSGIAGQLTANAGVGANNFLLVSLYISFINSLLEEFFFRGFAFLLLKQSVKPVIAYLFSAGWFALYHSGMTSGWFGLGLFLLLLLGLFCGGCIFNRLNEKSGSIYPSWLVHMFANFAINTIGMILFGMV